MKSADIETSDVTAVLNAPPPLQNSSVPMYTPSPMYAPPPNSYIEPPNQNQQSFQTQNMIYQSNRARVVRCAGCFVFLVIIGIFMIMGAMIQFATSSRYNEFDGYHNNPIKTIGKVLLGIGVPCLFIGSIGLTYAIIQAKQIKGMQPVLTLHPTPILSGSYIGPQVPLNYAQPGYAQGNMGNSNPLAQGWDPSISAYGSTTQSAPILSESFIRPQNVQPPLSGGYIRSQPELQYNHQTIVNENQQPNVNRNQQPGYYQDPSEQTNHAYTPNYYDQNDNSWGKPPPYTVTE